MIVIRPFLKTDEDYRAAADIANAVWVDNPETVAEWKEHDEKRSKVEKWGRYLAELDGRAVGYAHFNQSLWMNHPGKLWVNVLVLPRFRKRGVGAALWKRLCRAIEKFDPLRLVTSTREDFCGGIRFLEKAGFRERMREWESWLDACSFDPAPWARYARRVAEQGIEFKTVAELASDPARDRKLYELEWLIDRDVPSVEPPSKLPFEEFQKVWERSSLLPDGWHVALDGSEYVGMTNVFSSQADPKVYYVGLTGVIRSHRSRGIATALKLKSVEYARERGVGEIRTWNESNNAKILGINNRMGFVRKPAHISYAKEMREERPEDADLKILDSSAERDGA